MLLESNTTDRTFDRSSRPPQSQSNGIYPKPFILYTSSSSRWSEHDRLDHELGEKVKSLRSLSIKIGDEVRAHNNLLSNMAGAFDRSEGVLRSTMSRVTKLAIRNLNSGLCCYLLCFAMAVFFVCWLILRTR